MLRIQQINIQLYFAHVENTTDKHTIISCIYVENTTDKHTIISRIYQNTTDKHTIISCI